MYSKKRDVLARVRGAHSWLLNNVHGQMLQLLPILEEASQELEAQPTELWMQTVVGPGRHVKIFVEGGMDVEAIDMLIKWLEFAREAAEPRKKRSEEPPSVDAVDPVEGIVTG